MTTKKTFLTSLSLLAVLAVALIAAGCGSSSDSSSSSDDKLAGAVPADTPLFVEATVRPTGDQATAVKTIAADFPGGGDVAQRLTSLIDQGFQKGNKAGTPPTFAQDIDPWLGDKVGVAISNFSSSSSSSSSDGVAVAEVTDENAAKTSLAKIDTTQGNTTHPASESGVDYTVDQKGDATAVTDGLLLAGPEADVKKSIDTIKGSGDTLADSSRFGDAVNRVDGGSVLGFLYLDTARIIELQTASAGSTTSPDQVHQVFDAIGIDDTKPVSVSVTPEGDQAKAVFAVPMTKSSSDDASGILEGLPGDAVAAFAAPKLGESIGNGFVAALKAGNTGQGTTDQTSQSQLDAIGAVLGIDPADIGTAIGGGGIFVDGTNMKDLKVGLVADVTDPTAIGKALDNVKALAGSTPGAITDLSVPGATTAYTVKSGNTGSPLPIEVAYDGKKLVIGGGTGSAALGLNPPSKLSDSQAFSDLGSSLADAHASAFIDTPKLIQLLVAAGATAGSNYATAAPYLNALGQFALGSTGVEDGYQISNAVLTFQPSK